jgi:hypothetical protein
MCRWTGNKRQDKGSRERRTPTIPLKEEGRADLGTVRSGRRNPPGTQTVRQVKNLSGSDVREEQGLVAKFDG